MRSRECPAFQPVALHCIVPDLAFALSAPLDDIQNIRRSGRAMLDEIIEIEQRLHQASVEIH
ncbi:hypothetical protein D3C87_1037690 [compost metagenome]